jgi:hypothetical protein
LARITLVAVWFAGLGLAPRPAHAARGDVLLSWFPAGVSSPWGLGYSGTLWVADVPGANTVKDFTREGFATERAWHTDWATEWPADMTYVPRRGLFCQVNVGGDNGIHCWDPTDGTVAESITGDFPWTEVSQRGLAYRADDDSFYIGGWNQGVLYHIKGLSHPDRGAVIGRCYPPDGQISGLAYNAAFNVVWVATNSRTDTIYQLNADTCEALATLAHPQPGFNGGGLEMDENGNLWMVSLVSGAVLLVESGLPAMAAPRPTLNELVDSVPDRVFRDPRLRKTLQAHLSAIYEAIDSGQVRAALHMLRTLRARVDGCGTSPGLDDWLVSCSDQSVIRFAIDTLITSLEN